MYVDASQRTHDSRARLSNPVLSGGPASPWDPFRVSVHPRSMSAGSSAAWLPKWSQLRPIAVGQVQAVVPNRRLPAVARSGTRRAALGSGRWEKSAVDGAGASFRSNASAAPASGIPVSPAGKHSSAHPQRPRRPHRREPAHAAAESRSSPDCSALCPDVQNGPAALCESPFGRSGAEAVLGTRGLGRGDRNVAEAISRSATASRTNAVVPTQQ